MGKRLALLRSRVLWLREPTLGWVSLAFVLVTITLLAWVRKEPQIRWWGLALQCVGMGTVLYDLLDRGKTLGASHPLAWGRKWLSRWPGHPKTVELSASAGISFGGSASLSTGSAEIAADATVEQRLEILTRHVEAIEKCLVTTNKALHDETAKRKEQIRDEQRERREAIAKISGTFEKVLIGSFSLSWFGVIWLFVGAILSTGAPEIGQLANWFFLPAHP